MTPVDERLAVRLPLKPAPLMVTDGAEVYPAPLFDMDIVLPSDGRVNAE